MVPGVVCIVIVRGNLSPGLSPSSTAITMDNLNHSTLSPWGVDIEPANPGVTGGPVNLTGCTGKRRLSEN